MPFLLRAHITQHIVGKMDLTITCLAFNRHLRSSGKCLVERVGLKKAVWGLMRLLKWVPLFMAAEFLWAFEKSIDHCPFSSLLQEYCSSSVPPSTPFCTIWCQRSTDKLLRTLHGAHRAAMIVGYEMIVDGYFLKSIPTRHIIQATTEQRAGVLLATGSNSTAVRTLLLWTLITAHAPAIIPLPPEAQPIHQLRRVTLPSEQELLIV